MNTPRPISDAELNAFVDGELDEESSTRVEIWLANHPEDAERVETFRLQNAGLKNLLDSVLEEPVPAEMLALVNDQGNRNSIPAWMQIAAAFALLVVGGALGWGLRGSTVAPQVASIPAFVERAVGAHVVYTSEVLHPVEVTAEKQDHLVAWLSKRLGNPVKTPRLEALGYQLVGGRLLEESGKPAAQFMYEDNAGRRVTVYVRAYSGKDTAFKFYDSGDASAFYWIDAPFAYALTGEMSKDALMKIARKVYAGLTS